MVCVQDFGTKRVAQSDRDSELVSDLLAFKRKLDALLAPRGAFRNAHSQQHNDEFRDAVKEVCWDQHVGAGLDASSNVLHKCAVESGI